MCHRGLTSLVKVHGVKVLRFLTLRCLVIAADAKISDFDKFPNERLRVKTVTETFYSLRKRGHE